MKDNRIYLEHILDSIVLIEQYTRGMSVDKFKKDSKTVDAVIRNFEIIGEAAGKLPQQFRDRHPEVPWKSLTGLRNVLIHEYFGVDVEAVWENIGQKLPELKTQMETILSREEEIS